MEKNNYSFSYTNYETFGDKIRKISSPQKLNYSNFIKKYFNSYKHYDD